MTDARFPERWLNDRRIMRLAPEDFRSFVVSLTWSVSNRTDGRVEPDELGMIPGFDPRSVSVFVAAGLWDCCEHGWQITDFHVTQSTAEQLAALERQRALARERQARKRAKAPGDTDPDPDRDSSRDVTRDVRRDSKARTGQARQGQEGKGFSAPTQVHDKYEDDLEEPWWPTADAS